MKLLLDTHLLLWATVVPRTLSARARALIEDTANDLYLSAASLWEIAIKHDRARNDFEVDPRIVRRALLDNGYTELAISTEHAMSIIGLPPIHKNPFDRLLIAQAMVEGITLLTVDKTLTKYPGSIQLV